MRRISRAPASLGCRPGHRRPPPRRVFGIRPVIGSVVAIAITGLLITLGLTPATLRAVAATAAAPPIQYVALGDSYSAGEGLAPYQAGTDTDQDTCNRSTDQAYPSLVAKFLKLKSFSFHACSGAHLSALTSSFKTEPPQLGWLSSSTNLVTLSLGGNDLNWSQTVAECAEIHDGGKNTPVLYGPSSQCEDTLAAAPSLIFSITNQLFASYKAIRAAAPNARIRVMLYPPIFPDRGTNTNPCVIGTRYGFAITLSAAHETAMLNIEQEFNNAIQYAVDSIRENFNGGDFFAADPWGQFLGYTGHTISCGDAGRDKPWINALRTENFPTRPPTSEAGFLKDLKSLFVISDGSFHPTVAGQKAMAQALEQSLALSPPPPTPSPTPTSPAPPVIATTSLPNGVVGQNYSQELSTADQRSGTWTISTGSLPPGLTLTGSAISGTPTAAGKSDFTVTFTDSGGQTAQAELSITVTAFPSTWTATQADGPPNANPSLVDSYGLGVSCPSTSSCFAVGGYEAAGPTGSYTAADLLTLADGMWTVTEAPLPANAQSGGDATLAGISCPSGSACTAAGYFTDAAGNSQGLLLTLTGGSWTATEAPLPANAENGGDAQLAGVSCTSISACVAVGFYTDTANHEQGLLLTLAGGLWTATEAPLPANGESGGDARLNGVSCPSVSSCVAAGFYGDSAGHDQGLLLTLAGGSWMATEAPLPANVGGNPFASLYGVSCPSASACVATGHYEDTANATDGLLLTLAGGSWTAAEAPLPANATGNPAVDLNGVSCSSASACVATGSYAYNVNLNQGELLTLSNGSWTAIQAPSPANPNGQIPSNVFGVSCPSVSECFATGNYGDGIGVHSLLLVGP